MSTVVATQHSAVIRAHYQPLLSVGNPSKLALTACMRNLLADLHAMAESGSR